MSLFSMDTNGQSTQENKISCKEKLIGRQKDHAQLMKQRSHRYSVIARHNMPANLMRTA